MCYFFFQEEKGERREDFWGVLLLGKHCFSCPSPGAFLDMRANCPPVPLGTIRLSPILYHCLPALITHYWDLTNPLLAVFCVIFWSVRLSRCCDCENLNYRATQGWKTDRHSASRGREEEKKLWAHLQRNKTFRSHKQTSTCSISAFVLFVNN